MSDKEWSKARDLEENKDYEAALEKYRELEEESEGGDEKLCRARILRYEAMLEIEEDDIKSGSEKLEEAANKFGNLGIWDEFDEVVDELLDLRDEEDISIAEDLVKAHNMSFTD